MRFVFVTFGSWGDVQPYVSIAKHLKAHGHAVALVTSKSFREPISAMGLEFAPMRPDVADLGRGAGLQRFIEVNQGSARVEEDFLRPALQDSKEDLARVCQNGDVVVAQFLALAAPLVADEMELPWVSTIIQPMTVAETRHSPYGSLALFSPTFVPREPSWPDDVKVTGFPVGDRLGTAPLSAELESFLGAGEAPLVFTLGTAVVGQAGDFFQLGVRAAQQLKKRAVFLVGRGARNTLLDLPEGMMQLEFALHSSLFRRALAVIHHGGIGTTANALLSGRPMLVVPFAFDQPDNASRAVHHGVARVLPRVEVNADRLGEELRALLDDRRYLERAAVLADKIREEDGVGNAARELVRVSLIHLASQTQAPNRLTF